MATTPQSTIVPGMLLAAASAMLLGAAPAFAHGGSVTPPSDQQECSDLALYDKGEGDHAQDGTSTAGEQDAAVEGGHCR